LSMRKKNVGFSVVTNGKTFFINLI